MIILLGTNTEMIQKPGSEPRECPVTYFMEFEERQVIVRRCAAATEKSDRTITYKEQPFRVLDNLYYGRIDHAINGYLQMATGHNDIEGAIPVLHEIKRVLDEAVKAVRP